MSAVIHYCKTVAVVILFLFLPCVAQAQEQLDLSCRRSLTPSEIESIKESKRLLSGVDAEPLEKTISGINKTSCPVIQGLMLSAISRTYDDLIREYNLQDQEARVRLYNRIQLNMAYLQFTAGKARGDASNLNRLIRQKLTLYLPQGILEHPAFYQSVEQ